MSAKGQPLTVILIGWGAIAQEVAQSVANDPTIQITHVLVRDGRREEVGSQVPDGISVISSPDDVRAADIVLECASHDAVASYAPDFLARGFDVGIVSTGVFSDPDVLASLLGASEKGGGQIVLAPGAVGGMDALAAARTDDLASVVYTSRKPPMSWSGTPADEKFDLASIDKPTVLFEGTAREAAHLYPKNANVAATIALAGLGFEKTRVTLYGQVDLNGGVPDWFANQLVTVSPRLSMKKFKKILEK